MSFYSGAEPDIFRADIFAVGKPGSLTAKSLVDAGAEMYPVPPLGKSLPLERKPIQSHSKPSP